jgi:hypothetical protein
VGIAGDATHRARGHLKFERTTSCAAVASVVWPAVGSITLD